MPPKPKPPRLTHFLCLPLITPTSRPQLLTSLTNFRSHLSKMPCPDLPEGFPPKAIRPLGTLHLTIGVMSLLTPERVSSALKVLQELDLKGMLTEVVSAPNKTYGGSEGGEGVGKGKEVETLAGEKSKTSPSLNITLQGLISMHQPTQTSILYSSPLDPHLHIYNFCLKLQQAFTSAGLLVEDKRPLLLHATIINTIYVPGVRGKGNGSNTGHGKSKAKLTFDARDLLEDFEDFEWMRDVRLEKVAICRMGAKVNGDGEEEYKVEGEVDMP